MVFEGVKLVNSNRQEKSFWVSCATRPIHSVHGRLRHRQSCHVLKEFDNGSWWIPAVLLDAHVATWVNWTNLSTWVLSFVVDFREYSLLRHVNVTKIALNWVISKYQITPGWRNVCCHGVWSCWTLRQVMPGNTWEMLVLQAWWTEPRWAPVKSHCAQVGCIGIRKLRRGSCGLRGADLLERSLSENEHWKSFRDSFHVFRFHSWLTSNSYQFIFASQLVISFFMFGLIRWSNQWRLRKAGHGAFFRHSQRGVADNFEFGMSGLTDLALCSGLMCANMFSACGY